MRHSDRNFESDENDTTERLILNVGRTIKARDFGVWSLFSGFVERYGRKYESKREILRRFRVYKRNVKAAKMWQENEQGTAIYGQTQFMDMTPKEFRETLLPYTWQKPRSPPQILSDAEIDQLQTDPIPDSFDWRDKNVVTDVKNQEQCEIF